MKSWRLPMQFTIFLNNSWVPPSFCYHFQLGTTFHRPSLIAIPFHFIHNPTPPPLFLSILFCGTHSRVLSIFIHIYVVCWKMCTWNRISSLWSFIFGFLYCLNGILFLGSRKLDYFFYFLFLNNINKIARILSI